MKIAFLPGKELEYSRIRIFINGLKDKADLRVYGSNSRFYLVSNFVAAFKFIFRKKRDEDVILVGIFGHLLILLLKPWMKKRIIFDPFMSLYDTLVNDKKKVGRGSLLGKFLFWIDRASCRIADVVIVDTFAHGDYFVREIGVEERKIKRVFVGSDNKIFYPRQKSAAGNKLPGKKLIVGFYGWFIPLQGAEYIVRAAGLLKNESIEFRMVGRGQTYSKCVRLSEELGLDNITFLDPLKLDDIPGFISGLDIGLGVFGESDKTGRVIPNKAYDIIAMKKPLITADSEAIRELFTHRKNAFLCKKADALAIADAILHLKKNKKLRESIAEEGYKTYLKYCTPEKIGASLIKVINSETH